MENSIKPVTNPEEAADQFAGEQYMEWVLGYVTNEAKSWPSLQAVAQAHARPEKAKKLLLQRYVAAEALAGGREGDPGFLGFAVANLSESPDPGAERALEVLEAMRNDVGGAEGQPNQLKALWAKLLRAMGAGEEELARIEAKEPTRTYVAEMADAYSNGEWQTAVAALVAQERLVAEEFAALSAMVKSSAQLAAADMEILSWHPKHAAKHVMDGSRVLEQVAVDQEGKSLVFEGIKRQLEAMEEYYDGLAKYLQDN